MPDYIGFVFVPKSKRYISFAAAENLRKRLNGRIIPVGVFANEALTTIEYLVNHNIIGAVQLHGTEDKDYIKNLRNKVKCPIIQAFCINTKQDIERAENSEADFIILDSGGGTGTTFNHSLTAGIKKDFFLAGGLDNKNVVDAILKCQPYAVDASSSLETDGVKDKNKMEAFVKAVRYGKDDVI